LAEQPRNEVECAVSEPSFGQGAGLVCAVALSKPSAAQRREWWN
jgi:hypothetical protein